jgi:hypothetical protein
MVIHDLGRYPYSVTVVDDGGRVLLVDMQQIDANSLLISPSNPITGKAYIA